MDFRTLVQQIKKDIKLYADSAKNSRIAYTLECRANRISTTEEEKINLLKKAEERRKLVEDYRISKKNYRTNNGITVMHIIYNRLRHRPAHLGSLEKDDKFLLKWGYLVKKLYEKYDIVDKDIYLMRKEEEEKWKKSI